MLKRVMIGLTLLTLAYAPHMAVSEPKLVEAPPLVWAPVYAATIQGVQRFIVDTVPSMASSTARRYAKMLVEKGQRYGVDPLLMASVVYLESGFQRNKLRCDPRSCDHGLGQINTVWVDTWNLDADRLVTDDAYNLTVVAKVLALEQRDHPNDPKWWSNYHDHREGFRRKWEEKLKPTLERAFAQRLSEPPRLADVRFDSVSRSPRRPRL